MRPNYTASTLFSARDLNDEQANLVQRLRRHDRFTHGSGIVCGLQVYAAPDRLHPWRVGVCPGYAVGPCGDEIEIPARVLVNVRDFAWSRPYVNGIGRRAALVGIRFTDESATDESENDDCGCGCSSVNSSPGSVTRVTDGYSVDILWVPEAASTPVVDLCRPGSIPCPATPSGLHIMLAILRLPAFDSTPLTDADIDQL